MWHIIKWHAGNYYYYYLLLWKSYSVYMKWNELFYRKWCLVTGAREQFTTRWQHKAASCENFQSVSTMERVHTIAHDLCIDGTTVADCRRLNSQLTYLHITRDAGRSDLACLTAVHEVPGSNRAVGSCVYRTTTVIYSLGHGLCAPFLQCIGQLSLPPSVGR